MTTREDIIEHIHRSLGSFSAPEVAGQLLDEACPDQSARIYSLQDDLAAEEIERDKYFHEVQHLNEKLEGERELRHALQAELDRFVKSPSHDVGMQNVYIKTPGPALGLTFTVKHSVEDDAWIGRCVERESLAAHGDTAAEALAEIMDITESCEADVKAERVDAAISRMRAKCQAYRDGDRGFVPGWFTLMSQFIRAYDE